MDQTITHICIIRLNILIVTSDNVSCNCSFPSTHVNHITIF